MTDRPRYVTDPAEIYRRSFAIIEAEAGDSLATMPADVAAVARRIAHACGQPEICAALAYRPDSAQRASTALAGGAPILCDSRMTQAGVTRRFLPADNPVMAFGDTPEAAEAAKRDGTTVSAAAAGLWHPYLDGAVVAIGSAPTALFKLLTMLDAGAPAPAAVLAFPVGFVGAAESKAALMDDYPHLPHITLPGRRGGAGMAAAAVNAVLRLAQDAATGAAAVTQEPAG